MINNEYIFIVGVGRSGTSLLQSMFAAHPEVSALPETSFLRRYAFAKPVSLSRLRRDEVVARLNGLSAVDKGAISGSWIKGLVAHYISITKCSDKKYILDKDPRLVEFLDYVRCFFPDSKIIHIFRDPRDVLLSKKKAKWSSGRSLFSYLVASAVQLHDVNKASRYGDVISIKYEDLITQPAAKLKSVCESAGLEYSAEMLHHSAAARQLVQPAELSWKKETFEPVNSENFNKWKSELTTFEAISAVLCVKSFCRENGYTIPDSACSKVVYAQAYMFSLVVSFSAIIYRLVRRLRRFYYGMR